MKKLLIGIVTLCCIHNVFAVKKHVNVTTAAVSQQEELEQRFTAVEGIKKTKRAQEKFARQRSEFLRVAKRLQLVATPPLTQNNG